MAVINDTLYELDRGNGTATAIGPIGTTVVSSLVFNDTISQQCPCNPPGEDWKNQGEYTSCVAQQSEAFVDADLITEAEKEAIVAEAAGSDCGKSGKSGKL